MKKLAEYEDLEAVRITGKLLSEIARLQEKLKAKYPDMEKLERDLQDDKSAYIEILLDSAPEQIKNILAILNGVPREEYHCTAATVAIDLNAAFSDEDFAKLFSMQS